MWMDLDFSDQVIEVRRAYVWAQFKVPKSKASKAPVPMHPVLAGFLVAWREKTPLEIPAKISLHERAILAERP